MKRVLLVASIASLFSSATFADLTIASSKKLDARVDVIGAKNDQWCETNLSLKFLTTSGKDLSQAAYDEIYPKVQNLISSQCTKASNVTFIRGSEKTSYLVKADDWQVDSSKVAEVAPKAEPKIEDKPETTSEPKSEDKVAEKGSKKETKDLPTSNLVMVEVDGYGKTIDEATKSAAVNALTQVVGSFMDVKNDMKKQEIVQKGVKETTKSLSSNIKEYSQGSIASLDVLQVDQSQPLIKVTAKVGVRKENFQSYVEEFVKKELNVSGTSMFAKAAVIQKQQDDQAKFLLENVINPIDSGGVTRFKVTGPHDVLPYLADLKKNVRELHAIEIEESSIKKWVAAKGSESVYAFEIEAYLDPEFKKNMEKTLAQTASLYSEKGRYYLKRSVGYGTHEFDEEFVKKYNSANMTSHDAQIIYAPNPINGSLNHYVKLSQYVFKDVIKKVALLDELKTKKYFLYRDSVRYFENKENLASQALSLNFLDKDKKTVYSQKVTRAELDSNKFNEFDYIVRTVDFSAKFVDYSNPFETFPWILVSPIDKGITIASSRKMVVILKVPVDKMPLITDVSVTLVN